MNRRPCVRAALLCAACVAPLAGQRPAERPAAATESAPASRRGEAVEISNRFVPGRARRYRVESTVTTKAGRRRSPRPELDAMYADQPAPPDEVVRFSFDEEERCEGVDAEGVASVAYRCLRFARREQVGDEVGLDVRVDGPADLRRIAGVPKLLSVGALVERPVRFRIDPTLAVRSIELPEKLPGGADAALREEYRRNLESRYRAFFPAGRAAPGDVWKSSITTGRVFWSASAQMPDAPLTCETTFLRRETFEGLDCAVLSVALRLDAPQGLVVGKTSYDQVVADRYEGTSLIRFCIPTGTPIKEETRVAYALRRVIGNKNTEKIEIPFGFVQTIVAQRIGGDDEPPRKDDAARPAK